LSRRLLAQTNLIPLTVACLLLAGCHHKQKAVPVLVLPPTQVPVEPVPLSSTPPHVPIVTTGPAPEASVTPPKKVKKPRRTPVPPAPAPVQVASVAVTAPAAVDVIGALTSGEESSPDQKVKTGAMIAEQEKRLKDLPAQPAEKRREVERVRYFCKQARAALKIGDVEGASTLATKAKVLLDELFQ
jgi:hypothetical protein